MSHKETMGFQTEVKRMLDLVVHSLYSNKEIFLRELISNASDALDKLRFLALSDASLYEQDSNLRIEIKINEKLKTLTIIDNGIGMTRDEAIENLGTIAKSGTREFLSHMTGDQNKDSQLIGQFGVGFYSSFIVADEVTVESRRAGQSPEEGIIWRSKGEGEFSIENKKREARGTAITLHLKKDEDAFLSDWKIRGIITKYSDHIAWPIVMEGAKTTEDGKTEQVTETVNKATALWTLSKSQITDEEYKAFYKHISHAYDDPLTWAHNHVEGKNSYVSLLYIPAKAPFDLWQQESKHGLKLYVKRVFILDEATQFLPRYLRFVKGIIDASDLPLNVSREILQDNKQVDSIRQACTKRILSLLEKMSQDTPETYQKFWDEFGLVLKEGPLEDFVNRDSIAKLLRFTSTESTSEEQKVSLADYISRMQEKQDKIYYLLAPSFNAAKHSPHLEIFKKKGIEVLLLTDKIDSWLVGYMNEFEGKKLASASDEKLEVEGENVDAVKEKEESLTPMLKQIKEILGEKVEDVVLTSRLTDSPACVVSREGNMGFEMQRILQAAGQKVPDVRPVFELNPEHELVKRMHAVEDDAEFSEWAWMLFEQSILAEGGELNNPAGFVARVNQLLLKR